jgi:dTDP-4-dehydrorhamnose 3,5-epimerase
MRFRETTLPGAFVVQIERQGDDRGFFARTWCTREFAVHGLPENLVQTSMSRSERRGTVRGMHLQLPPSTETKLVRCTRGAIYDVIVDLRPDSATFLKHFAIELVDRAYDALLIPPMMLHGFQTLEPETEVLYSMTDFYAPELGFGARWNDPAFGIKWPITNGVSILPRDAEYPDFDAAAYRARLSALPPAGRT